MQGLATLWLLSTPAVSGQLHRWALHYPPPDLSAPIDADAIVILGGRTREVAAEYEESAVRAIVLVTSALHMRRAVEEFESQGLRVIAAPVDAPGPTSLSGSTLSCPESRRSANLTMFSTSSSGVLRVRSLDASARRVHTELTEMRRPGRA